MQIKTLTLLLASFAATNVMANPVPNAEAGIEARAEQAAQAEQAQQGAQAKQGEQWYPGRGGRGRWFPQNDWRNLRNPFPSQFGNRFGWDGQQCPWQPQSCWNCQGFYQGNQGVCGQGWARGCPCF
ncbi:hypothetical protein PRZ48_007397 [Zasmidium cellare]|uniref:Uncharacterized protein n=1 Tax=Zasmidium cellare TaxID=395010 RepID=A0ABR0EK32_ZASCE|nr:hypothetical protein PRZ48_007397 [Zasmidium cellare]